MSTRVDYQQFIKTLKKLIDKQATTNLILLTDDNHSLWIGLVNGEITSIIFGPKRGKAALPKISKIHAGQLSLDTKTNLPLMSDLPSTEVIFAQLSAQPTTIGDANRLTGLDNARLNLIVEKLQQLLKQYVGPIANMIMPSIIKQVGDLNTESELQELIEIMAKEVDGIGDADKFLREALDIVKKM